MRSEGATSLRIDLFWLRSSWSYADDRRLERKGSVVLTLARGRITPSWIIPDLEGSIWWSDKPGLIAQSRKHSVLLSVHQIELQAKPKSSDTWAGQSKLQFLFGGRTIEAEKSEDQPQAETFVSRDDAPAASRNACWMNEMDQVKVVEIHLQQSAAIEIGDGPSKTKWLLNEWAPMTQHIWWNRDKPPKLARSFIHNFHSQKQQPVSEDPTGDERVSARLGMVVFWVLALQRNKQDKSPVLTFGVCDRTKHGLSQR